MKILIVEDLTDDRRLLRYNMEKRGHEVIEAANGEEALALIDRDRPDLIVSDLLMPVLDGFGLLKALKNKDVLSDIPFVVYSSVYTGSNEKELAFALGADGFMVKPLEPDELWREISEVLNELKDKPPEQTFYPEHHEFLEKYSSMVATRLEVKVQELKAAEKDLKAKEKRYRSLFSSMMDAIVVMDTRWKVMEANQPALRKQLGLELDELMGYDFCSFFSQAGVDYEELRQRICSTGALPDDGLEVIADFEKKDKTLIRCRISFFRLLDEQERFVGIIGVLRDITEQAQAEERLRQARQEWEKTFDSIGDIVTLQDKDMHILRINKAGLSVFKKNIAEVVGQHCYELFRSINEPCPGCPLVETLNDSASHSCEIFHEGLNRTFLVSASPILDETGTIIGIAHFAKDISVQKDLENQLRQTQKLESLGTLAGGIAHDFNNILAGMLGYAELLAGKMVPGSQEMLDVKQILSAGDRAKEVIGQILAFSRSGDHKFEIVRVQDIIAEALKLLRASIPSTIEIQQQIDGKCPAIQGDATQILQVIMNLCTNAYYAMMERGGVLNIRLHPCQLDGIDSQTWYGPKSDAYLELVVEDTGSGIEQNNIDKIFEPYFTTKEQGKGTGLGLSVVHGIVRKHGGNISVSSQLGTGTIFHVYLPIARQSEEMGIKTDMLNPSPHGHERLLIVDDEEFLVKVQKRSLESLGYLVTPVTSSIEALEIFRTDPDKFDLILTDLTMPKLNGLELAKEIRSIRNDIPIVLCSGYSNNLNDKKLSEAGIRFFVMKPIAVDDLGRKIREALDYGEQ